MEYFDICDENGMPTGETISREEAHRDEIQVSRERFCVPMAGLKVLMDYLAVMDLGRQNALPMRILFHSF